MKIAAELGVASTRPSLTINRLEIGRMATHAHTTAPEAVNVLPYPAASRLLSGASDLTAAGLLPTAQRSETEDLNTIPKGGDVIPFPNPAAESEWDRIVRKTADIPEDGLLFAIEICVEMTQKAVQLRDPDLFYSRVKQIYAIAARILIEGGELPECGT